MSKAKLLAGAALVVLTAATLVLLTHRAKMAGLRTYCRNNLRHLGALAHAQYAANYEAIPELAGRAFWQSVREAQFHDQRNRKWIAPPLNPFTCPVKGTGPLDLGELDPAALTTYCSDAKTIDYRGPAAFPDVPSKMVLGADREGNHPDGGGHVLTADFTVLTKDAVSASSDWAQAATTRD